MTDNNNNNDNNNKDKNIVNKQLGGIVEIDVKLKMPKAFVDYINEVAIKQKKWAKDIDEYCNDEVLQGMIAHSDGGEDIHLRNYTIPKYVARVDSGRKIIDACISHNGYQDM